ncbi:MAG: amidohydrolase, partial [Bacteroidota bacterium]
EVDLIVHNALIYTVDSSFSQAEAFAVKDGKFLEIGSSQDILEKYQATEKLDAEGQALYPGFIDAHCHYYRYSQGLQVANLVGSQSYKEIQDILLAFKKENPEAAWIVGRGWDQNDWENKAFPNKAPLDSLFPNTPVYLVRVDGHAALANQKALDLAGVDTSTPDILGGSIIKENGALTGVLIDNAMGKVSSQIPEPDKKAKRKLILDAQANCFAVGLTGVHDAGLSRDVIEFIDALQQEKALKMRLYIMISSTQENLDYYLEKGPFKNDHLNVSSFKIYADGALGSRGACLLQPYSDAQGEVGFLKSTPERLDSLVKVVGAKGFQVNTHCIGDSANRLILDIYGKYLDKENDRRWRIEHAQIVNTQDIGKFAEFKVIPSVQPTHATSDMYWADERLGDQRIKEAYTFKDLLKQNNYVALGSDFPVEDINPLFGFYAAIARQDAAAYPEGGFQMENALSREEALKGMTIWAAYSAFEENQKGSIEAGKFADFVILKKDIMKVDPLEARNAKVWQTYLGGQLVYKSE